LEYCSFVIELETWENKLKLGTLNDQNLFKINV
jgi:hypothetical protein